MSLQGFCLQLEALSLWAEDACLLSWVSFVMNLRFILQPFSKRQEAGLDGMHQWPSLISGFQLGLANEDTRRNLEGGRKGWPLHLLGWPACLQLQAAALTGLPSILYTDSIHIVKYPLSFAP